MISQIFCCTFTFIVLICLQARAQVDATSSLLLRSGREDAVQQNLDSGRYILKNSAATKVNRQVTQTASPAKAEEAAPTTSMPEDPKAEAPTVQQQQSLTSKIKSAIFGEDDAALEAYLSKLQEGDTRTNIVNLAVAPGVLYVDSSSSYWFRRYHSSGPGVYAGAEVWFTPFAGFDVDYMTSLAAELNADPATTRAVLVDHRFTDVGFQLRNYASLQKKSMSFVLGLKYSEYQMMIPKDELLRTRIKSSGVCLSMEVKSPQDTAKSWMLFADLLPKLKVKEGGTMGNISSGANDASYAVRFGIGQEFKLDRQNQIYWKISHRFEKTIYQGSANTADPITGLTPEGVSVSSGITIFNVGYTWGD